MRLLVDADPVSVLSYPHFTQVKVRIKYWGGEINKSQHSRAVSPPSCRAGVPEKRRKRKNCFYRSHGPLWLQQVH